MRPANEVAQCNAEWASESKWAVRLSGRIPVAGEIKRENRAFRYPTCKPFYSHWLTAGTQTLIKSCLNGEKKRVEHEREVYTSR